MYSLAGTLLTDLSVAHVRGARVGDIYSESSSSRRRNSAQNPGITEVNER